ncbi:hypothetical protein Taro_040750, partial [Colocasia esculenta]|nr:hypothetical protein [Colocasia esculenta]
LLKLAAEAPASYYYLGILLAFFVFVYNLVEFHVFGDVLRGCRGDRVTLTFRLQPGLQAVPARRLQVPRLPQLVSPLICRPPLASYLVTPWLASPHLQTAFLHFFGNPPKFAYRRQVFHVSDVESVALDWLLSSDVAGHRYPPDIKMTISKDDTVPIVVMVPGLTSDSSCSVSGHPSS